MEELYSMVMAIVAGTQNPYLTIIAAVCVLALGIFGTVFKAKMRADKAEREKEADKERDLGTLENANAQSEGTVLDRLNRRNTSGTTGTDTH
jgi:fucose permease